MQSSAHEVDELDGEVARLKAEAERGSALEAEVRSAVVLTSHGSVSAMRNHSCKLM